MRKGHTFEELLFWRIYDRPQCQRGDLAEHFGVSAATVSRAVAVLLEKDLVVETAADNAAPGRKPYLLQVNSRLATLLGLEIDVERVLAVVTDMAGVLLGRGAACCDAKDGIGAVLAACRLAAAAAMDDAGVHPSEIRHLGAGHPGHLDIGSGVCLYWANAPGWSGVPVRDSLADGFGIQVTLDDRSRALALGERRTSPEDWQHSTAIYISAGSGIGMGIFIDGRLFRGGNQRGGEIGHTLIDPNGPLCNCGSRGCVEAYAGTGAILRRAGESLDAGASTLLDRNKPLTIEAVVSAARQGDRACAAALDAACRAIGVAVANLVQILNPTLVVLCNKLARLAGDPLRECVTRAIASQCAIPGSRPAEVRVSPPKKDIAAVGCALLAAEAEAQRVVRKRLFGEPDEGAATP